LIEESARPHSFSIAVLTCLLVAGTVGSGCKSDSTTESATTGGEAEGAATAEAEQPSEESEESASESNTQAPSPSDSIPGGDGPRTFKFTYEATLTPGDASGPVDMFVPVAVETPHQTILDRSIDSPVDGEIREESTYGNEFWHGTLESLPDEPTTVTFTYTVRREVYRRDQLAERSNQTYPDSVAEDHDLFLQPNERVPVSGDLIDKVTDDINFQEGMSPLQEASAIYDYVIDTMEYKKEGTGWGNGDTYWACEKRYGNCTDFHALYTSLARNRGIPARFEIGFPVPTDRKSGKIGGYHCWLQFYLPGVGWTPVDASEAHKHPDLREMYFGTHPANRIRFTVGRDLKLGKGHETEPLNYFVYPHVEVGGERYEGVETSFSYEETDA